MSVCTPGGRCLVWGMWTLNLLISSVYLGISMVTFHNIKWGVTFLGQFANREAYKNSLLASCMLGFLVVLFWVVFSFFVLLGRLFSSLPLGYGVMLGSCSHTGFFMLLAGLVLQTHEYLAAQFRLNRIWNDSAYQTYVATYAFSYILCGTYLIMFMLLTFTSGAFTKKEERSDKYVAKTGTPQGPAPAAASGTASTIPSNHGFGVNWPGSYQGGNV